MIVRTGAPDDIPALQVIEKKARIVYAALGGFEFVAASPPIAADRLILGTTFIAEVSESLVGFALVQPMDGALYLANIRSPRRLKARRWGSAPRTGDRARPCYTGDRRHPRDLSCSTMERALVSSAWLYDHA
jgi:hypothetical protein